MTETVDIRAKTRRVKDHILTRYLALAEKIDKETPLVASEKELYRELTLTFARNVVPRSHEHAGDPDNETPIPILMNTNVLPHNGDKENSPTHETDSGSSGRNLSE